MDRGQIRGVIISKGTAKMSLGLSAYHTGGEFSPRYQYDAKSGRMSRVDRTADGAGIIKVDVTMQQPVLCLDIGSIQVGFASFPAGAAPTFVMVPYGQTMPARRSMRSKHCGTSWSRRRKQPPARCR